MSVNLEQELQSSADFVTQAEIKVCLECGCPYPLNLRVCPKCRTVKHVKTLLIISTWRVLPRYLQNSHSGPGVRVTNFGNAI